MPIPALPWLRGLSRRCLPNWEQPCSLPGQQYQSLIPCIGSYVPGRSRVLNFSDFLKTKKKSFRQCSSSPSSFWRKKCSYAVSFNGRRFVLLSWRLSLRRCAHGNPHCNGDWLVINIDPRGPESGPSRPHHILYYYDRTRIFGHAASHPCQWYFAFFSIYWKGFLGKTFLITCANIRSELE